MVYPHATPQGVLATVLDKAARLTLPPRDILAWGQGYLQGRDEELVGQSARIWYIYDTMWSDPQWVNHAVLCEAIELIAHARLNHMTLDDFTAEVRK
jgi:hypothetical protein